MQRLRGQLAMPPDLDEAGDPDERQPAALENQPVADAEEGGEGLVESAQDLPLGAAAVSGQFRDRVPDGLLLVRLVRVAEAAALPLPCLDVLLEARVAEVAEVSGHVR